MTPDPPGELLVEQRVERPQEDPYAKRVHRDGSVYEYTSTVAHFQDGEWRFDSQPLEWRLLVRLPDEAVAALEAQIRRDGIVELPPDEVPRGTSIGSDIVWTVEVDGKRNTVTLHAVSGAQPAPFDALDKALQLSVAQELDADAPTST
jgi:hypothetical protein